MPTFNMLFKAVDSYPDGYPFPIGPGRFADLSELLDHHHTSTMREAACYLLGKWGDTPTVLDEIERARLHHYFGAVPTLEWPARPDIRAGARLIRAGLCGQTPAGPVWDVEAVAVSVAGALVHILTRYEVLDRLPFTVGLATTSSQRDFAIYAYAYHFLSRETAINFLTFQATFDIRKSPVHAARLLVAALGGIDEAKNKFRKEKQ